MKKKGIGILPVLLAAIVLSFAMPAGRVNATEADIQEDTKDSTEETEYPESYYLPIESNAIDGWPSGPQVEAEAAVVMDAKTGAFLYSKNMEAKEYPASITKIMTTLVALEHGDLDSKVKFSDWAINSLDYDSSKLYMEVGEKITLKQALYGVMLASANDCANAVAEKVGGNIENFAKMMNEKAAELGCVNTHFVNAHGLHDENHYTCAKDMALIMRAAMENDTFSEIVQTTEYSYPKTNKTKEEKSFVNHQKMLYDEDFYYKGCLGGKTGFTDAALNTLVTVAKKDGRKLICVVLRTNGAEKTYRETTELLDYGYENFTRTKIPITDGQATRAEILGALYLGKTSALEAEALKEPMILTEAEATVSLPKDADVNEVVRKLSGTGTLNYTYHGWPVSTTAFRFNSAKFDIPAWTVINENISVNASESETESETGDKGFVEQAESVLKSGVETVQSAWTSAWDWAYEHDVFAAIVGLILIILLLPLAIVAYVRNRSSQKIRKQRQKEKEERIRIEKDIESKSAIEIEEELRAQLEKERIEREKREAEKKEQERIEREIEEAVKIIEKKEALEEASQTKTETVNDEKGTQPEKKEQTDGQKED